MDRRKEKRYERKVLVWGQMYDAYNMGLEVSNPWRGHLPPRLLRNPFPAGRRHEEWERGYASGVQALAEERRGRR